MSVRVIIFQQSTDRILREWDVEEDEPLSESKWRAVSRLWPSELLDDEDLVHGFAQQPSVLLCLDRDTLGDHYDANFLRTVIRQAHKSMWGAKVYVVVDSKLQLEWDSDLNEERKQWFEMLLDNGVTDVLQLPLDPETDPKFRHAMLRSHRRLTMLDRFLPDKKWLIMTPTQSDVLPDQPLPPEAEWLLDGFLSDEDAIEKGQNSLLVLRDSKECQLNFLSEKLKAFRRGGISVGLLSDLSIKFPPEFQSLLKKHDCPVIELRGLFELHYFMQNLAADHSQYRNTLNCAEFVIMAEDGRLNNLPPQLLITHAFVPTEEDAYYSASQDFWALHEAVKDSGEVIVYPSIKMRSLQDLLNRLTRLLAWVHIGHGNGDEGLQEANGLYRGPENWLKCFAQYNKGLPLVVFSSCKSEAAARKFAEAGVGVAIGFRQTVRRDVCERLTSTIIKAAFDSGGNRKKILEAFSEGKRLLESLYYEGDNAPEPVAFCSRS